MIEDEIEEYDNARTDMFLNLIKTQQQEIADYQKTCNYANYTRICKELAKLIKELAGDIQDDRMYMAIYIYLYSNGFLSINKHFEFGKDNSEISCNYGLSMITGKGFCRNIAACFKDILIEMKKMNDKKRGIAYVGTNIRENRDCIISRKELPEEFNINISTEENKGTEEKNENTTRKLFLPNHAEILVMYSDKSLMLYDPTNIRITKINLDSQSDERIAIDMRPSIIECNPDLKTAEDRENYIKRFVKIAKQFEKSKREPYSKKDIRMLCEFARRQCNTQKDKIEEFYESNKMWFSIINEQKENFLKEQQEKREER